MAEEGGRAGRGLIVAAPASGSGKTLVAAGLIAALRARGRAVAAAKVGPDYIDPRFLEAAAGRPAPNLDLWAMREPFARALLAGEAAAADFVVVEGVMGLFDGPAGGRGSTADVARWSGLPVILVVDAARQSQSVAALVHGFASFDLSVRVAGVILTRVASERHERLLREALAAVPTPLLGVLHTDPALTLASRHLGLVQAMEVASLGALLARAGEAVAQAIDLDAIEALAAPVAPALPTVSLAPLGQRIAVARDEAFAFAYPHLLDGWRRGGASLSFFSPLADEPPDPDADAVFLPGGYPELYAGRLAAAARFGAGLTASAERGALIYGECGGYMVLGVALIDADGVAHEMTGLLSLVTSFATRRRTLGYRRLAHAGPLPFAPELTGHEFHYATLARDAPADAPLFAAWDAAGAALGPIGSRRGRVMGSFAHVIDAA